LVWKFGLIGLWVAGDSFRENVHADRHCDPRDARLAVHLCTTDGAPADCVELNHKNQGGPKRQCGHYPGKRRVKGEMCVCCFVLRVEFLLKTESGYLRDAEVT